MFKRLMAIIVVAGMVVSCLSSLSVSAATINDQNIGDELLLEEELLLAKENAKDTQIARDAYFALNPEARAIFDESISQDTDLVLFHKTYVDASYDATMAIRDEYSTQAVATTGAMAVLSAKLALLKLPSAVLYSLKAMGASMVASIAEGPLPLGKILLVASTVGVAIVVAANWNTVVSKWQGIVDAFKAAFSNSVSTVVNAFNRILGSVNAELAIHPCVTVSIPDRTITVDGKKYACRTKATPTELENFLDNKSYKYVPGMIVNNILYFAPMKFTKQQAIALLAANIQNTGVITTFSTDAKALFNGAPFNGVEKEDGDPPHYPAGNFYAHFHAKNPSYRNVHSWFLYW